MSNPTLREGAFEYLYDDIGTIKVMTTSGTLFKTCVLGILVALTFAYTWWLQMKGFADKASLLATVGAIGGFVMAMIVCFAPKNKFLAITTSIYALFEGLFLGSISAVFNAVYPGVVFQAATGTILTIFVMYFLYSTKIIKATSTFYKVVLISTFSIAGVYLLQFVLTFFHLSIPGIFTNSWVGILFTMVCVAVAALNLILDFNFIDNYSGRVPEYFEWYGGFSLMVTIVWLYIELLKLFAKFSSRR